MILNFTPYAFSHDSGSVVGVGRVGDVGVDVGVVGVGSVGAAGVGTVAGFAVGLSYSVNIRFMRTTQHF